MTTTANTHAPTVPPVAAGATKMGRLLAYILDEAPHLTPADLDMSENQAALSDLFAGIQWGTHQASLPPYGPQSSSGS